MGKRRWLPMGSEPRRSPESTRFVMSLERNEEELARSAAAAARDAEDPARDAEELLPDEEEPVPDTEKVPPGKEARIWLDVSVMGRAATSTPDAYMPATGLVRER